MCYLYDNGNVHKPDWGRARPESDGYVHKNSVIVASDIQEGCVWMSEFVLTRPGRGGDLGFPKGWQAQAPGLVC